MWPDIKLLLMHFRWIYLPNSRVLRKRRKGPNGIKKLAKEIYSFLITLKTSQGKLITIKRH